MNPDISVLIAPLTRGEFPLPLCLEGNAGVGKSTQCQNLSTHLGVSLAIEYTESMNLKEKTDLISSINEDEQFRIWATAEKRRFDVYHTVSGKLLLDTSLISVIGFEIARIEFGMPSGSFNGILKYYLDAIKNNFIVLPRIMILLRASEEVRLVRLQIRGSCHPMLARTDVALFLDKIRLDFVRNYLPFGAAIEIDTSSLSAAQVFGKIIDAAKVCSGTDMTRNVLNWMEMVEYIYYKK